MPAAGHIVGAGVLRVFVTVPIVPMHSQFRSVRNRRLSRLSPASRKRVFGSIDRMVEAYRSDDPSAQLTEAVRLLLPGSASILYDWKSPNVIGNYIHSEERVTSRRVPPFVMAEVPKRRLYSIDPTIPEPDANRPVLSQALERKDRDWWHAVREGILAPLGASDQLRTAVYDERGFVGLVVQLRHRGDGRFGEDDAATTAALVPALVDVLAAHERLGLKNGQGGALVQAIDAFREPAYVATSGGTIVYANREARRAQREGLRFARSLVCTREGRREILRSRAVALPTEGSTLFLVIPEGADNPILPAEPRRVLESSMGLSPSLADICELLLMGHAEKEISDILNRSLPTVRTYVRRIYERLDVHSRAELMRHAVEHGWKPR